MAYQTPTRRKGMKREDEGINLIPILDAVFIFIFFLLMSAQFLKIYEIGSDVPIISNTPPPPSKKKPLALTLKIDEKGMTLYKGVPSSAIKRIQKTGETHNLVELHEYLVQVKKNYVSENSIILEPTEGLSYEEMVGIMDAVRMLNKTDDAIYTKDKDGLDIKVDALFDKIIFGNLMS